MAGGHMKGGASKQGSSQADSQAAASYSPILRWAGSKKRSLPDIIPILPRTSERYLEVFAGSACLFFHMAPARAVISDSNPDLIRFYRAVARHPELVYEQFVSLPRTPETYYRVRSEWSSNKNPISRAALFLYLNRNCFNGIYRTNT